MFRNPRCLTRTCISMPKYKQVRFMSYTIDEKKNKSVSIETNLDTINNNNKLKEYIMNIYKYSGIGFATSLASSLGTIALITSVNPSNSMMGPLGALWLGNVSLGFYSCYKINKLKSITNKDMSEEIPEEKKKYHKIFFVSNGISFAPFLMISYAIDPMILPIALTTTLATFGGATYYAMKQTNLNAISWQAPLRGCFVGLIGANLAILLTYSLGYTSFSDTIGLGALLVSTAVFTGFIVVDTQKAITDYKEKTLDTITTSTKLLLDSTLYLFVINNFFY